ncbi:hypothetical protein AAA799E16_01550 [Marine Group I thaumarchaeote SCGC AAA799-E16]|uniref:Uncharacterized protein n=4 Tax=Marine Group I TaxID=905826 RepID=A0A081RL28_9ARCH|nr:hypothetical protein AAA799N04_01696 [Marine Group I thaumarchaeote SCGC AAA799-N04]KER05762.1 hypothetical protein AAA799E16_01550 [Marine Group I thaumarchaeote SCGC AAA799-E16]KFM15625.1 hypothetical protein AAA799D11_01144 [Marine Group I thaumarchaeote SCGC AAA799-D11]KFM15788.1 hypothetical protein SCCGRSA3_02583 [Marine Group I thaumarchaeote SCGC RSA3]
MSDEEELEFWELLHQPLRKENAEKFQKVFSAQESKNNIKKEYEKIIQIESK